MISFHVTRRMPSTKMEQVRYKLILSAQLTIIFLVWIFVHVPVYSFADEYSLFEYVETPYISPGSSKNVAMRIHSDTKLVAISKDDSKHQVYSYEQLQKSMTKYE